jgi:hypothetical protein
MKHPKTISRNSKGTIAFLFVLQLQFCFPSDAFENVRKATISFFISVRQCENLGSHWRDFHKIWIASIFRKSVEIIQILLKYNKNNGHFLWRPIYIAEFFTWREMFQTKVIVRSTKHIFCSIKFFFPESLAVFEIMLRNIVQPDRPQTTIKIWRMRFACWIAKARNTRLE